MTFSQITWRWDGWAGAPGFSTFRMTGDLDSTQADAAAAAQRVLLAAHSTYIPSGVSLSCDTVIKIYADGDGSLVDQRAIATVPSVINGSGASAWAAVAGACLVWRTQQSSGRRMVMGRTFLVPLANAAYNTSGQLLAGFITASTNAANTYIGRVAAGVNGHPVVWHRPSGPGATNGFSAPVTGATINKSGAELRRRRD